MVFGTRLLVFEGCLNLNRLALNSCLNSDATGRKMIPVLLQINCGGLVDMHLRSCHSKDLSPDVPFPFQFGCVPLLDT